MIEIDHNGLVFDLMDAHGDSFSLRTFRRQHRSYLLSLGWKLVFGNLLERVRVGPITIFGFDDNFLLIADFQPCQFPFETGNDLSAAVEVCQRFLADILFDDFPVVIGEGEFNGDEGAVLNDRTRF